MFKKLFVFFILFSFLHSCSPSKKSLPGSSMNFPPSTPKAGDDGLSFETAVVITETSQSKGVKAEYKWIANHYSNFTIKMQSAGMHNNKPYDIITIRQSNGEDLKLYFDISNFYGKF